MKFKNWSDFRAHCSEIQVLMTYPKYVTDLTTKQAEAYTKLIKKQDLSEKERASLEHYRKKRELFLNPPLSESAKKYLITRYSKEKYDKRRAISGIQLPRLAKGTALEDEAMKMLSQLHNIQYCRPAEVIQNDYLRGKCDILCEEMKKIVEMKIVWSADSFFPYLYTGLPTKTWFQAQGYLDLYGMDYAQVCYVLVNTPQHLIDQEMANTFRRYTYGEIDREQYDERMDKIAGFYNYDNIPLKRRVITFEVRRSPEIVPIIKRKVDLAREWLDEFEHIHMLSKNILTLSEKYIAAQKEVDIELDTPDSCESYEGG